MKELYSAIEYLYNASHIGRVEQVNLTTKVRYSMLNQDRAIFHVTDYENDKTYIITKELSEPFTYKTICKEDF